MAFDRMNFRYAISTIGYHPSLHSYASTVDNIATIIKANYFVAIDANGLVSRSNGIILRVGDLIMTRAKDGPALLIVDTVIANASDIVSAVTVKSCYLS